MGRVFSDLDEPGKENLVKDAKKAAKPPVSKPQLIEVGAPTKPLRRSVFDQAKNKRPDFIIVPAGTEIRVDIVDGKVVVPVRVGFATPIPALSKAAVKVSPAYYAPVFYNVVSGAQNNAPVAYGENAELTAVTVRGRHLSGAGEYRSAQ